MKKYNVSKENYHHAMAHINELQRITEDFSIFTFSWTIIYCKYKLWYFRRKIKNWVISD